MFNWPKRLFSSVLDRIAERVKRKLFAEPSFVTVFGAKALEPFDVRRFAQLKTAEEAGDFYNRHLYGAEFYDHYLDHIRAMAKKATAYDGAFLEFGVATGTSIKVIQESCGKSVTGFDSFEGLPEDWRSGVMRGAFAMEVPKLPPEISLKIGRIETTLPAFLETMSEKTISFIHIDTDLYAPARLILSRCAPFMYRTVIVFDEFFNYPGWKDHEHKAFTEFQQDQSDTFEFKYLGLGGLTAVSVLVTRK